MFGGASPPAANAAVCMPAPPKPFLAVFKLPPVDQAPTGAPAPVHSSATPVSPDPALYPPAAIADPVVPPPAKPYLATDKSPVSVQLVPFHSSVKATKLFGG